jgi:hypothetical protein
MKGRWRFGGNLRNSIKWARASSGKTIGTGGAMDTKEMVWYLMWASAILIVILGVALFVILGMLSQYMR